MWWCNLFKETVKAKVCRHQIPARNAGLQTPECAAAALMLLSHRPLLLSRSRCRVNLGTTEMTAPCTWLPGLGSRSAPKGFAPSEMLAKYVHKAMIHTCTVRCSPQAHMLELQSTLDKLVKGFFLLGKTALTSPKWALAIR